jgi:hypothetical protein
MKIEAFKKIKIPAFALMLAIFFCVAIAPTVTYALPGIVNDQGQQINGLIPCDGGALGNGPGACTFNSLLRLGLNVMYYLIYIAVPFAAISFAWAGFLYMTSAGNPSRASRGRQIFTNVGIGLVIILAAWLIVYTITSVLLAPGFSALTG